MSWRSTTSFIAPCMSLPFVRSLRRLSMMPFMAVSTTSSDDAGSTMNSRTECSIRRSFTSLGFEVVMPNLSSFCIW